LPILLVFIFIQAASPGHQIPPDKLKISLRNRGFPVGWDHFRDRF
jgi:hypothetical protein